MPGNFIIDAETTPTSTNETNVLYVVNASTNTNQLYNIALTGTSLDTSTNVTFRVYIDPTVSSNGTSITPISRNFTDGNTSSMNVYLIPTITFKGTKISTVSVITSGSYVFDSNNWYLLHGHALLITAQVGSANKGLAITMAWSE